MDGASLSFAFSSQSRPVMGVNMTGVEGRLESICCGVQRTAHRTERQVVDTFWAHVLPNVVGSTAA